MVAPIDHSLYEKTILEIFVCLFAELQRQMEIFIFTNSAVKRQHVSFANERQWRHSAVFIVNFEHTSHLAIVFKLLTLNM